MVIRIPGDGEIERTTFADGNFSPLLPVITVPVEDTRQVTSKRLRGPSEKSTQSSVSSLAMKGRYVCKRCQKSLSKGTKHPASACINYLVKNPVLDSAASASEFHSQLSDAFGPGQEPLLLLDVENGV
jgi:hypothetical protein